MIVLPDMRQMFGDSIRREDRKMRKTGTSKGEQQEERELAEEVVDLEAVEDTEEITENAVEAGKKKHIISVPRLQSMDSFLMAHYRDFILQELNKRLVSGELSTITDMKVCSERIVPGDCCFRHFDYWRLNQTDLIILMEVPLP